MVDITSDGLSEDGLSDLSARRTHVSHVGKFLHQILRLGVIAIVGVMFAVLGALQHEAHAAQTGNFEQFLTQLWPDAEAAGISRATFDEAFRNVRPDSAVLAHTRKQAEFVRPIWIYLDGALSASRIAQGQAMNAQWQQTLKKVEARYGVDSSVVLGIWGMETNFGSNSGNIYTIRALATLAYAQYRGDFFRKELLVALKILENGDIARADMRGSWAGAMGQAQFMPSAFQTYAVDFTGNGHRDIWTSVPDALASTANYLKEHGWIAGETWGYEVELPDGFEFGQAGQIAFANWARQGLTRADGEPMPDNGTAALLLPAGRNGPAFLMTPNFQVIKSYNNSLAYALGVALLADRIASVAPLKHAWPRHAKQLNLAQMQEIQHYLRRLGYNIGDIDGKFGEKVSEAIRAYQKRTGLIADGYPTAQLLEKMRKSL